MKDDGPRCFVRPSPLHRSVGLDGVAVLQRVGDRVQGVVHTLSVVIPDYPCSAPDEECRAAGSPHVTGEQCLRQPVGLRGVEQIGPCDGAVATVLGGQLFEEAAPSIRHPWRPRGRPEPKAVRKDLIVVGEVHDYERYATSTPALPRLRARSSTGTLRPEMTGGGGASRGPASGGR